ncbi:hypothetical protein E8E11_000492 [Didymella keratinophila]|nr:hypothetical protein E8E11_000492 [Didymella keratinophila]
MEGLRQETEQLNRATASLTRENSALKELLDRIKQGTDDEAYSTFLQLRSKSDLSVLNVAQHLTVQVPDDISEPGAESSMDFSMWTTGKEVTPTKAKPWTTVAEDELVAELIASWFMWDDAQVCPCIDREALLGPAGAAGAQYCSPFLINVMCAARCVRLTIPLPIKALSNLTAYLVTIRRVQKQFKLQRDTGRKEFEEYVS